MVTEGGFLLARNPTRSCELVGFRFAVAFGMATTQPPPSNDALLLLPENRARLRGLARDRRREELEDYRTINPERGPVR